MLAWSPIGDNDFVGWFTTIAYAIVAILCWRIWYLKSRRRAGSGLLPDEQRSSRFWFFIAVTITLLGLNKEPDIQTLFLAGCKDAVRALGWMGLKKKLQLAFVAALALAIGAFSGNGLLECARRARKALLVCVCGDLSVGCFCDYSGGTVQSSGSNARPGGGSAATGSLP